MDFEVVRLQVEIMKVRVEYAIENSMANNGHKEETQSIQPMGAI